MGDHGRCAWHDRPDRRALHRVDHRLARQYDHRNDQCRNADRDHCLIHRLTAHPIRNRRMLAIAHLALRAHYGRLTMTGSNAAQTW
ncbi:MAG: hypothetical protein AB8G14_01850 [Ilumatobacter sp.]